MKKKILFVINTMGQAGAEKAMVELMKVLDKDTYDISLFSLINRGEMFLQVIPSVKILNKNPDSGSVLNREGTRIIKKTVFRAMFKRWNIIRYFTYLVSNFIKQLLSGRVRFDKLLWRLISEGAIDNLEDKRAITQIEYDVAIAYIEGGATYFVADFVRAKRKIAFIHIDYKEAGYTPSIDKNCYDKFDKIFAVSLEVMNRFLEVYPNYRDKISVFHNVINKEEIVRLSKSGIGFKDNFTGRRIVTVGRLHYQKGYDIAIEVLKILKKDGYDVKWYVLGEGMERPKLEKLIKENKLESYFILMGAVANPYPFMKEADLYVHVTRFEGKSVAIEEAQCLGKAIIASNCTGNREQIISGVDGIIVDLDVKKIALAIENLLDNDALRERLMNEVLKKKFDFKKDLEQI